MQTITLTETGEHIYTIPEDVYKIDVKCIGPAGSQFVENIKVDVSQQIQYYIQRADDTTVSYFGPYVCAISDQGKESPSRIVLTLYQ